MNWDAFSAITNFALALVAVASLFDSKKQLNKQAEEANKLAEKKRHEETLQHFKLRYSLYDGSTNQRKELIQKMEAMKLTEFEVAEIIISALDYREGDVSISSNRPNRLGQIEDRFKEAGVFGRK